MVGLLAPPITPLPLFQPQPVRLWDSSITLDLSPRLPSRSSQHQESRGGIFATVSKREGVQVHTTITVKQTKGRS